MFNLGYKEVVLNSDNGVYVQDGNLIIEGYGKFKATQINDPVQINSAPAVGEQSSWAIVVPADLAVGDAVEVAIDLRSSREVSDLARDFITHGEKIVFQSAPVTGVTAADIEAAVAKGWGQFVDMHPVAEQYINVDPNIIDGAINIIVLPGYEHIWVKAVKLKRAVKCEGADNCFVVLAKSITVEGSEGVGLGKFIEESRRMATPQNVMPYAQQHGGNSQGVDVRGTYKTYMFDFQGEDTGTGWESHEYVDHSYVNASMMSKSVHYVIYANDASTDLIAILDAFIV